MSARRRCWRLRWRVLLELTLLVLTPTLLALTSVLALASAADADAADSGKCCLHRRRHSAEVAMQSACMSEHVCARSYKGDYNNCSDGAGCLRGESHAQRFGFLFDCLGRRYATSTTTPATTMAAT